MLRAFLGLLTALSAVAQQTASPLSQPLPQAMIVEIVGDEGVSAVTDVPDPTNPTSRVFDHYGIRGQVFTAFSVVLDPGSKPGEHVVTIRPVNCTPETILTKCHPGPVAGDPASFTYLPPAAFPEKKPIREGETLDVPTVANAAGQRLMAHVRLIPSSPEIELAWTRAFTQFRVEQMTLLARRELEVQASQARLGALRGPLPDSSPLQPLSGKARDIPAKSEEFALTDPKAYAAGKQYSIPFRTKGTLIWFYLPDRGRYILSLTPRPALGFKRAGEMEFPAFRLLIGTERINLMSLDIPASQYGPDVKIPKGIYHVYVLHDPQYAPTSSRDQGKALLGTVSVRELEVLRDAGKK